ncbi:hypothetical protein [Streptomyces phaeoluteigriseus]|uniref:hypothetical protein n=1 Tax=Streptomyces phaeoluteigriseus TaxID=114686 RepID=UPI00369A0BAF
MDALFHLSQSSHPQIVGTLLRLAGAPPDPGQIRQHLAAHLGAQLALRHRLQDVGGRIRQVPVEVRLEEYVHRHAAPLGTPWEEVVDELRRAPLAPAPAAPWDAWIAPRITAGRSGCSSSVSTMRLLTERGARI